MMRSFRGDERNCANLYVMNELSNIQIELLKLFSTGMTDEEVIELKDVLSRFHAEKGIEKANAIWDERNLTDAYMDKWLNEKS